MFVRVSCPFGLVGLLTTEVKRLGFTVVDSDRTGLRLETDRSGVRTLNLRSRIANKVMIEVSHKRATSFEELFNRIERIDRSVWLNPLHPVTIKVVTKNSALSSVPTLQSVVQKAIIQSMHGTGQVDYAEGLAPLEVILYLDNDRGSLLLNTSGSSLHQRGRRRKTGEAPLKENIAAGMILMSGRRFQQPLRDPFCGSGTIAIEAALIASNRAPGLQREFDFMLFPSFVGDTWEQLLVSAKDKIYKDGTYQIFGSDVDQAMVNIAQDNAAYAKVDHLVEFKQADFLEHDTYDPKTRIITNPPYGKRLTIVGKLYDELVSLGESKAAHIALVTMAEEMQKMSHAADRTTKDMRNGAEEIVYWRSI